MNPDDMVDANGIFMGQLSKGKAPSEGGYQGADT